MFCPLKFQLDKSLFERFIDERSLFLKFFVDSNCSLVRFVLDKFPFEKSVFVRSASVKTAFSKFCDEKSQFDRSFWEKFIPFKFLFR